MRQFLKRSDSKRQIDSGVSPPQTRPKYIYCNRGFTLIELLVVAIILAILILTVIPSMNIFIHKVRVTRCIAEIRGLHKDIEAYVGDKGSYPNSLNDFGRGGQLDPWGNPYQYRYPGTHNPDKYDVWSWGPDGHESADDIGNW